MLFNPISKRETSVVGQTMFVILIARKPQLSKHFNMVICVSLNLTGVAHRISTFVFAYTFAIKRSTHLLYICSKCRPTHPPHGRRRWAGKQCIVHASYVTTDLTCPAWIGCVPSSKTRFHTRLPLKLHISSVIFAQLTLCPRHSLLSC